MIHFIIETFKILKENYIRKRERNVIQEKDRKEQQGLRALIIEDDPTLVMLIRQILKKYSDLSHVIDCAKTLEQAKELLANSHYDLAILDLNLPDSEGL